MKLPLLQGGRALNISQADGVIGGKIWPAASALCQYLLLQQQQQLPQAEGRNAQRISCVELGSGTGAVGLYAAAKFGYKTILTEHRPPVCSVISSVPYAVDGMLDTADDEFLSRKSSRLLNLLQANVDANRDLFVANENENDIAGSIIPRVMELDWSDPDHIQRIIDASSSAAAVNPGFDFILASDVTYFTQLHQPLAETIAKLLAVKHAPAWKTAMPAVLASRSEDATTVTPTPIFSPPKCLLAHQERLVDMKGRDNQLASFEKALASADLNIVKRVDHPVHEGSTTHKVSILEIQVGPGQGEDQQLYVGR